MSLHRFFNRDYLKVPEYITSLRFIPSNRSSSAERPPSTLQCIISEECLYMSSSDRDAPVNTLWLHYFFEDVHRALLAQMTLQDLMIITLKMSPT
ncbi:hypothetical protein AVEN_105800-1 [Araneus ventricosus]|uniref:Uncharacterized protein n=1 Tax=Araneus ventricosus TaxID=182803 RepID=A0A4Y2CIS3_ARAVE|nr:hypothetical protein AVEN_105800-1 [Araneus ventricosus]